MINSEGQVNAWKIAAWLAAAVLFFVVLWGVIASSVWGLRVATAGIYGRGEAHRQIQSAASRISNYEYFFNKCAAIQSYEARIDTFTSQLGDYPPGSRDAARLNSNLAAAVIGRSEAINQYNADAAKDYTRGQFLAAELPFHIENTDYAGPRLAALTPTATPRAVEQPPGGTICPAE